MPAMRSPRRSPASSAYFFGPIVVFWLLAAMAIASIFATLSIPADAIDDHVARGLDGANEPDADHRDKPSGFQVLLTCKPLLIFAAATVLFHFSNAAMLPLVGQKLALVNKELGTTLMSVCIVAAQMVMVPVAILVGRKADVWGRKPIFAAALGGAGAARRALSALRQSLLAGRRAIARRRRRRDFRRAVSAGGRRSHPRHRAFQRQPGRDRDRAGLGGALSAAAAGFIVVAAGYSAAFLFLAAIAAVGLALFVAMMPETGPNAACSWAKAQRRAHQIIASQ